MRTNYLSTNIDFSAFLKMTESVISNDKRAMERWAERLDDTDELIENVCKNNAVPYGVEINKREFIKWVESLGYRRE